jgi:hypothetical protein
MIQELLWKLSEERRLVPRGGPSVEILALKKLDPGVNSYPRGV